MKPLLLIAALVALIAPASTVAAKPKPVKLTGSVQIAFTGRGTETLHEYKQWIYQIDNRCGYDKTVDNRATFSWSSTWNGVALRGLARGFGDRALLPAGASTPAGGVRGADVRTDCGYPEPLEGWAGSFACQEPFLFADAGTLDARSGPAGTVILDVQAPTLALKEPSSCTLRPRNSQLTASFKVAIKTLAALKPGKALSIRVGTAAPSLVPFTREYNCSASEPPYEGVQIDDRCADVLSWEGTVTLLKR